MEGWIREIRLAVRSLAGRPGFAILAIVTLALGIGANTAIFSVIRFCQCGGLKIEVCFS